MKNKTKNSKIANFSLVKNLKNQKIKIIQARRKYIDAKSAHAFIFIYVYMKLFRLLMNNLFFTYCILK